MCRLGEKTASREKVLKKKNLWETKTLLPTQQNTIELPKRQKNQRQQCDGIHHTAVKILTDTEFFQWSKSSEMKCSISRVQRDSAQIRICPCDKRSSRQIRFADKPDKARHASAESMACLQNLHGVSSSPSSAQAASLCADSNLLRGPRFICGTLNAARRSVQFCGYDHDFLWRLEFLFGCSDFIC